MAPHDLPHGAPECAKVQGAEDAGAARQVVGGSAGIEQLQEPLPELGERERESIRVPRLAGNAVRRPGALPGGELAQEKLALPRREPASRVEMSLIGYPFSPVGQSLTSPPPPGILVDATGNAGGKEPEMENTEQVQPPNPQSALPQSEFPVTLTPKAVEMVKITREQEGDRPQPWPAHCGPGRRL